MRKKFLTLSFITWHLTKKHIHSCVTSNLHIQPKFSIERRPYNNICSIMIGFLGKICQIYKNCIPREAKDDCFNWSAVLNSDFEVHVLQAKMIMFCTNSWTKKRRKRSGQLKPLASIPPYSNSHANKKTTSSKHQIKLYF